MKTEPEPIDWSNWGSRTPDEVRAANLKKAYEWRTAQMMKSHAAEMAQLPERVDRDLAHKRIMVEHEAKMAKLTAGTEALKKRSFLFEIQNEVDELKDTVSALSDAVKDIAAASCPPETIEKLTEALTKITAAHSRPRRRVAIRNDVGDILETHDFPDDSITPGLDVSAKISELETAINMALGILADSMESVAKAVGPKRHIAMRDGAGTILGTIEIPEQGAANER